MKTLISIIGIFGFTFMANGQVDLPQRVDFSNFNGINLPAVAAGWQEAQGVGNPSGFGSGGWFRADVIHPQVTAGVFINSDTHAEWIISPKFTATEHTKLSFKAALTLLWDELAQSSLAFDDSLAIMYSYNGTQFFPVGFTFMYGNEPGINLDLYDVDLSSFAGQEIHVAFYATDGHIANSVAVFHLADIVIKNTAPRDGAVTKIISPSRYQCLTENFEVEVMLKNDGHEPIYSIPVRAKVRGANNQNYFGVYHGLLLPNETATFAFENVDLSDFGECQVIVETIIPEDGDDWNNTLSTGSFNNTEARNLPLETLTFTDFYYDNLSIIYPDWYEARGKNFPFLQTNTDWQGDFFAGSRTANVYFVALGTNDWIISPKFLAGVNSVVELKAAVQYDMGTYQMGSDDKLAIMISNNCGETWTQLGSIDKNSGLGDTFIDFSFSLSNFAGEELILGIYATTNQVNDPQSYLLHIDDVVVRNQYAHDAGIVGLVSPYGSCSFGSAEILKVLVKNFGSQSISGFQVGYSLNEGDYVFETVNQSIDPSETVEFTFSTTLNLSESQTNTIAVKTMLTSDEFDGNDMMVFTVKTNSFDFETQGVYSMGFEENEDYSSWIVINGNGDDRQWQPEHDQVNAYEGEYSMAYFSNNTSTTSNDWLISPCFYFKAGIEYSVSFWYKNRATSYPEMLKLCVGTSQSAASMTTVLTNLGSITNSAYQKATVTFSAPSDGEYYFGWHAYGPADMFGMHIDLVEVYQVFETDLTLTEISIGRIKNPNCSLLNSNKLAVRVKNMGSQAVSHFIVGVKVNDDEPVLSDCWSNLVQNQETIIPMEYNGIEILANEDNTIKVWVYNENDLNAVNDSIILYDFNFNHYTMGFEAIEDKTEWTIQDISWGNSWMLVNDASVARTGNFSYGIRTDTNGGNTSNNDWLFSECFYLDANKAYTLTFYYRSRYSYENLALFIGANNNSMAMTTQLFTHQNFYSNSYIKAEVGLTVEETGTYYFGWLTQSGTSQKYFIYIDDVELVESCQGVDIVTVSHIELDKEVLFFSEVLNATEYHWNFGDGNSSNQANPAHIYSINGTYTVTLTVINACSQDATTFEVEVICNEPVADFTFEVDNANVIFNTDTDAFAYEWNFGDGDYSNLVNPSHTYTESGTYHVSMYAFNHCGYGYALKDVTVTLTHIDSELLGSFKVYPNPTSQRLNIYSEFDKIYSVKIFDTHGRLVNEIKNLNGSNSAFIDVSMMAKGVYVIQIISDRELTSMRFTKM
jgi:PKD repeat protein